MTPQDPQTIPRKVQVFHMTAEAMADRDSWPEWLKERYKATFGHGPAFFNDVSTDVLIHADDYIVLMDGVVYQKSPAQFAAEYEPVSDKDGVIKELAMLVRRMSNYFYNPYATASEDLHIFKEATDYLTRHNLAGSQLRGEGNTNLAGDVPRANHKPELPERLVKNGGSMSGHCSRCGHDSCMCDDRPTIGRITFSPTAVSTDISDARLKVLNQASYILQLEKQLQERTADRDELKAKVEQLEKWKQENQRAIMSACTRIALTGVKIEGDGLLDAVDAIINSKQPPPLDFAPFVPPFIHDTDGIIRDSKHIYMINGRTVKPEIANNIALALNRAAQVDGSGGQG